LPNELNSVYHVTSFCATNTPKPDVAKQWCSDNQAQREFRLTLVLGAFV